MTEPHHIPSPDEIKERCLQVRMGWTSEQRLLQPTADWIHQRQNTTCHAGVADTADEPSRTSKAVLSDLVAPESLD
jgi:hypothetical protein